MDYKKLGLKCGLEIHQQLEGKKLFCSCPTLLRDDEPHFTIKRKLRALAGESGKVDIAAKEEQSKSKQFIYQGYHDTTCLVETDSEPPHQLNQEALHTALQLCILAGAEVFSIAQVMRKTVVDGSNTSGFQRTALLAGKGSIETNDGKVRISNISLEEEACKIISEQAEEKVYRLDRLGIPLIEIGTEPDIHTPEQCQEAARKIGLLLRSLPHVKRGLGTIRQDVNVSIIDGARVEIKGAQDLRMIPTLVELEAKRQLELLKIKNELRGTRLNPINIVDCTLLLQDCTSKIVQKTVEKKGKILGLKLNNFAGFLGRELQPGKRLGTELSERGKVKAGVGGVFHTDELPNYGIGETEVLRLRKKLQCENGDAFILVADIETKAIIALQAAYARAAEALIGVPSEVRKANPDGTTTYQRPMPGASRMYPETDVPLLKLSLDGIKVPETLEAKIARYNKHLGLSLDLATFIAKSEQMPLFEELLQKHSKIKPAFIAETLTSAPLEIKRNYNLDGESLTEENYRLLFEMLSSEKIHKDIVLPVLIDMLKGTFDLKKYETLSIEELHQTMKQVIAANKNAPFSALMGLCVKRLAGKASGKVIAEELKKIVESK